jgi:hypothetical protein
MRDLILKQNQGNDRFFPRAFLQPSQGENYRLWTWASKSPKSGKFEILQQGQKNEVSASEKETEKSCIENKKNYRFCNRVRKMLNILLELGKSQIQHSSQVNCKFGISSES